MLVIILLSEDPSAGGGDIGGGGIWNGRVGSVPCLCPYMFPFPFPPVVGVEFSGEYVV